jgi:hypothetical protein
MKFQKNYVKEFLKNLVWYVPYFIVCLLVMYGLFLTPWGQACMHAYERLIMRGLHYVRPDLVYVPYDLTDCLSELDRVLTDELQDQLKTGDVHTWQLHMTTGLWMRNTWGLWHGSRLSRYFNGLGIYHPDDMSAIILDSYVRRLQGEDIDLRGQIKFYQLYWKLVRALRDMRESDTEGDDSEDNGTGEEEEPLEETGAEPAGDAADSVPPVPC